MKVAAWATVAIVAIAMLVWNARHPRPIVWDDANYEIQTIHDAELARSGGPVRLAKAFLFEDVERPPAYRVIAFPFTFAGASLQGLRMVSIAFFVLSAALLYFGAPRGGAIAAMLFALSPSVIAGSEWFGTDYPVILASAMLLAALGRPRWDFWLTALGVALGLLAKTSFVVFGGTFMIARLLVEPWPKKRSVFLSGAIGALIAAPWWFWNWRSAVGFANYSRLFPRLASAQNTPLVNSWYFVVAAVGLPAAIAIVVLLWRSAGWRAALPAIVGAIALPLTAIFSPFLLERIQAPAIAALAFAVGSLAVEGRRFLIALGLFGAQLLLIVAGMFVDPSAWPEPAARIAVALMQKDNVDWSFLRPYEHVSFFGLAPSMSPPELAIPRKRAHEAVQTTWLWNVDQGAIDWRRIEEQVRASDVVLVPDPATVHPSPLRGLMPRDLAIHNEHDAQFVALVRSSGLFDESTRSIENVNPFTLRVFVRRRV